jgi:hypothetical protein
MSWLSVDAMTNTMDAANSKAPVAMLQWVTAGSKELVFVSGPANEIGKISSPHLKKTTFKKIDIASPIRANRIMRQWRFSMACLIVYFGQEARTSCGTSYPHFMS